MAITDILTNKMQIAGIGIPVVAIAGVAAYFLFFRKKKRNVAINFN